MRYIEPALLKAMTLSILLHALLFVADIRLPARGAAAQQAAPLEITLRQIEAPARPQPSMYLNESQPLALPTRARIRHAPEPLPEAAFARNVSSSANSAAALVGEAARQANAQLAQELFYPAEAIARGLEGEALVLLFLDASGNAITARVEASSGHRLLDDAAVRAARTLRALPDSAPREAVLPVRFRLR